MFGEFGSISGHNFIPSPLYTRIRERKKCFSRMCITGWDETKYLYGHAEWVKIGKM